MEEKSEFVINKIGRWRFHYEKWAVDYRKSESENKAVTLKDIHKYVTDPNYESMDKLVESFRRYAVDVGNKMYHYEQLKEIARMGKGDLSIVPEVFTIGGNSYRFDDENFNIAPIHTWSLEDLDRAEKFSCENW